LKETHLEITFSHENKTVIGRKWCTKWSI